VTKEQVKEACEKINLWSAVVDFESHNLEHKVETEEEKIKLGPFIALARALVSKPRLLILDEPLRQIKDPLQFTRVIAAIKTVRQELKGVTTI